MIKITENGLVYNFEDLHLNSSDNEADFEQLSLYKVISPTETIHFVLADSHSRAISQATCGMVDKIEENKIVMTVAEIQKNAISMKIPFLIAGCGRQLF